MALKPGIYYIFSLFLIMVVLLTIFVPTFIILGCYRQIIGFILKMKYGRLFGGLLEGKDAFWAFEDASKSIITALIIMESTKDLNHFIETLQRRIHERLFKKESKLGSIRQKFGGYSFLIKNQYSLDNAFKIINVYSTFDRSYLVKFVEECFSRAMPKQDTGLWEVLVFDKEAQWLKRNSKNQFVIVFRCHHSLGDGFALLDLLAHQFSSESTTQPSESYRKQWAKSGIATSWFALFKHILYGPAQVAIEKLSRQHDVNFLHRDSLCGEKIVAWAVEENPQMVPIVKMIKNKLPETRFSDVILCAISKSLKDFYLKKTQMVPKHITCVLPVLLKAQPDTNIFDLTNRYSVAELTLPVLTNDNIFEDVRKHTMILRNSPDIFVNHWFLNIVVSILPELLLKQILYLTDSTAIISILPGFKLGSWDGDTIRDIIYWVPHRGSTGIGFSVLTYENRFQIGIVVDKELPMDQNDAQMIIDGVFKSIVDHYTSNFDTL
ncbi:uncharacterized protein LOC123015115 [Tribolium madens]|uniref:uncharacterized protein LOC123015115 n=1 Tax=Tribolium madens TaxID=41895 RepID=UPI001CF7483F|nr:uncharacterized protein LOC123015115 [Tribolium madens]